MDAELKAVEDLIEEFENIVEDKSFPLLTGFVLMKKDTIFNFLYRLDAVLPDALTEARTLLKRKEELQRDVQQQAQKIITDAQAEASRIVSESDLLRAVQNEAEKIKDQVVADCEEIKQKALDEAESIRNQAIDEAMRIKNGSSVYAEQVLTNLEQNLNQFQEIVKNGQIQLEKHRAADESTSSYVNSRQEFAENFRMR